jgi:hypothetical protein
MVTGLGYDRTEVVTSNWIERERARARKQIQEKWLMLGLFGAGMAALAVWFRVMIDVITEIMMSGAAYFGG